MTDQEQSPQERRAEREALMREANRQNISWLLGLVMAGIGIVAGALVTFYAMRAFTGDSLLAYLGLFVIGPLLGLFVALRLWQSWWVRR